MSAQLKYGLKKVAVGGVTKSVPDGDAKGTVLRGCITSSSVFVGCCNGLKTYIFDYGALSLPELCRKSKDTLLNYIKVENEEGDAVAESILDGVLAYPPESSNPPARASRTNKEIWKR